MGLGVPVHILFYILLYFQSGHVCSSTWEKVRVGAEVGEHGAQLPRGSLWLKQLSHLHGLPLSPVHRLCSPE